MRVILKGLEISPQNYCLSTDGNEHRELQLINVPNLMDFVDFSSKREVVIKQFLTRFRALWGRWGRKFIKVPVCEQSHGAGIIETQQYWSTYQLSGKDLHAEDMDNFKQGKVHTLKKGTNIPHPIKKFCCTWHLLGKRKFIFSKWMSLGIWSTLEARLHNQK